MKEQNCIRSTGETERSFSTSEKPKLEIHNGHVYTTSHDLAKHFRKRHDNVLRDIGLLLATAPEEFNLLNFEEINYTDGRNRQQQMYNLTRDGFALLAMGFTGREALRWKVAYITEFNRMETELRKRDALSGVIRKADRQLELFPEFNHALEAARPSMPVSAAAILIESKRVMLPSPKSADLVRLIKRGELEGYRAGNGRWFVFESSLTAWLKRRAALAA